MDTCAHLRVGAKRATIRTIMARVTKDTKKENVSNEEHDLNHAEPRVYELGFHIDPELPKQKVKELFQSIKKNIEGVGTIIAVGEPHRITLAYTISLMEHSGRHDFSATFFGWIAYSSDGVVHSQIIDMIKEQGDIFRYIDIRTTKEEAQHAATQHEERYRREQKEGVQQEEKTDEEHTPARTQESKEKLDVAIENAIT